MGVGEVSHMPPKQSYWQLYDLLYKKHSKKSLFKALKKKAKKLGPPYKQKKGRGRKLKFDSVTYTSFISLQKIFRHRYREMELDAELYLDDKADHSTFARNYAKIPEDYIEKLVVSLVNKSFSYYIADSTAMCSKIRVERTRQGIRKKELLTDKYHIVIGYCPKSQMTMIVGVKATDNHISDSKGSVYILKDKQLNGYFFGDAAYNTYELHEVLEDVGLYSVIKPDKRRVRKPLSIKARNVKLFFKRLYKEIRGIVETVFGGATNAGLILSYAKKEHTRRLDTLMLALRHNLMASIRLLVIFFATNSKD
jgi:hypothetical protein